MKPADGTAEAAPALTREDFAPGAGVAPVDEPAGVDEPAVEPAPDLEPTVPTAEPASCAVHDVELVYVVDHDGYLSSFDPRKLPGDPFHRVGKLTCDPASHPFSMAVDRAGIAWVLYASGDVYRVSILDARCSKPVSRFDGRRRPLVFGMGFVTDGPTATTEELFIAADDYSRTLARFDTSVAPPRFLPVGPIPTPVKDDPTMSMNPELTGTSEGRLFAYFPQDDLGFVQELDRTTGKTVGRRLPLTARVGHVGAFAFAHWGGVFYVFATVDGNSLVHAVDRKTGRDDIVLEHLPTQIVGAGVSTCAPLLERLP